MIRKNRMSVFSPIQSRQKDDYMTPKYVWEQIASIIPRDKVIWEPFQGDGRSGEFLREMGLNVIHEKEDFFSTDRGDIVVSNPPFSKKNLILRELVKRNKPFILLISTGTLATQTFRSIFKDKEPIQIIIPNKRIQFDNLNQNGEREPSNPCPFDCFQFCWKIGLPKDLMWVDEL